MDATLISMGKCWENEWFNRDVVVICHGLTMDFDGEDDMGELPSAKQFANLNMAVESSLIHPLKMGALHSRYIYIIL